jgi:hypothetical protein
MIMLSKIPKKLRNIQYSAWKSDEILWRKSTFSWNSVARLIKKFLDCYQRRNFWYQFGDRISDLRNFWYQFGDRISDWRNFWYRFCDRISDWRKFSLRIKKIFHENINIKKLSINFLEAKIDDRISFWGIFGIDLETEFDNGGFFGIDLETEFDNGGNFGLEWKKIFMTI